MGNKSGEVCNTNTPRAFLSASDQHALGVCQGVLACELAEQEGHRLWPGQDS